MGVEQAGTWDLSLDELAYNNREEVHRNYITDNSQYKARAFDDGTVKPQGVEESIVQAGGIRNESQLAGWEDDSRGGKVCNGTLENDPNAAASPKRVMQWWAARR